MKQRHLILSISIATALAGAPAVLLAQPVAPNNVVLAGTHVTEGSRVTQAVNNNVISAVADTHLGLISRLAPVAQVAGSTPMNHLQLVLKPSAERSAALAKLIAGQHSPKSAEFHKWLTPAQYGDNYGVSDSDIAAVKSWLVSQGFTVNGVYPNKTQIDFSGTAGQIAHAFHTQMNVYKVDGAKHIANAGDISVPAALSPVVLGVLGLNDFHAKAMHVKPTLGTIDPHTKLFKTAQSAHAGKLQQAVSFQGGVRGLVPNDLAKIYNVLPLRRNGVTGQGITIALVEDDSMVPADWTNFVSQFGLGSFGGTFAQIQPQPPAGSTTNNCYDPNTIYGPGQDGGETLLDAEWSTAMAPGANIVVASCADYDSNYNPVTPNFFGGVFVAASNLINASTGRPDIISASYGYGEGFTDAASKTAIDLMWAQADAEGISVFVSSGDSGSNPSFNGGLIQQAGVDANSFATSPNVTAVGGTDFADVLENTSSQYFSPKYLNVAYGTALSYVPEIPWNQSCGNAVAAKSFGFSNPLDFCKFSLKFDPQGYYVTSEAGSGGPSSFDRKPVWQRTIMGAAQDQSRDVPDVSLFAGSYGGYTWVVTCTAAYPCAPNFTTPVELSGGTSLASPMFAGIQALIDQGMAMRGLPPDQGNAAPTLYALAQNEYGTASGPAPASLATCSADNGTNGTSACVFHNITSSSISTQCAQPSNNPQYATPDCYFYGTVQNGAFQIGLTSTSATSYGSAKAYPAQPGWSFANGLGSVNATNLMMAWRAFIGAPPAPPAG